MTRSIRSVWRHAFLWTPPIVYAVLIFYLSSESNPLPPLTSTVWDKALHTAEYTGMAFLVCRAVRGEGLRRWKSVALAILIASAYAASDEWHQLFVPGRNADVLDWIADTIGAVIGATAYSAVIGLTGAPATAVPTREADTGACRRE